METILQTIYDSIVDADYKTTAAKVQQALDEGIAPDRVLNEGMVAAMAEVGKLFEEGEFFVPEMLISARAMQAGLAVLKPHMIAADVKTVGTVVAGTVEGDMHDIGKNLVCMMLEGAAFEIVDLGADVSSEKFVEAVKQHNASLVAMSALLTTTMPNMRQTILKLEEAGMRDKVKVMVGGAPLSEQYAREIGADGFAPDASRAVVLAKSLIKE